jgi:hypothetical protein
MRDVRIGAAVHDARMVLAQAGVAVLHESWNSTRQVTEASRGLQFLVEGERIIGMLVVLATVDLPAGGGERFGPRTDLLSVARRLSEDGVLLEVDLLQTTRSQIALPAGVATIFVTLEPCEVQKVMVGAWSSRA